MIQQTIDELRELKQAMQDDKWGTDEEYFTLNKAIIACEQLRKARKKAKRWKRKQEPCDDAISRQAVLELFEHYCGTAKICNYNQIFDDVKQLPSVRPQEQTGHWIKSRDCYGNYHFTCSKCGNDIATQYADKWEDKYCSDCGAKMVEPTCDTCKYNTAAFMPCNACDNKSLFEPQESEVKDI